MRPILNVDINNFCQRTSKPEKYLFSNDITKTLSDSQIEGKIMYREQILTVRYSPYGDIHLARKLEGEGGQPNAYESVQGGRRVDTLSTYARQRLISFLHTPCNIFICIEDFMLSFTKFAEDASIAEYV